MPNGFIFSIRKHLYCLVIYLPFLSLLSFNSLAFSKNDLLVCVDPDWMPFEGIIDGQHTGIARDYLKIFKEQTPFNFIIKPTSSWKQSTDFLKAGKCDLTLLLNRSVEREAYLSFTLPYFFGPNVLVSKKEIPFMQDLSSIGDLTLGIVSGYRLLEDIPAYYPDVNVQVVSSEVAGLKALDKGFIDIYVGSLFSVNLRINQLKLSSLKINGWIMLQDELRIGVIKSKAEIIPTFNRVIDQISTKQHNDILYHWSNAKIIEQDHSAIFYYIFSFFCIIILFFLWRYNVSSRVFSALQNQNEELEKARIKLTDANTNLEYLSFHDNLTELYNRHYFRSHLQQHMGNGERHTDKSSILMIDLDFFKMINDQHGHAVGDKVLMQFANILSKTIRTGDVAARWGGEEFIVLLPTSEQDQVLSLSKRLVSNVEETAFEKGIALTISIGISRYKTNDSVESWIDRADTALYQAKNSGRNCFSLFEKD